MKTGKILLSALLLASSVTASAKNADELRVYVNPGHGSWTVNDRAMSTIAHGSYNTANPDTTGFFESNTNLWKCLGLVDKLAEYGLKFDRTLNQDNPNPARRGAALDMRNNIVMSHVKLGSNPKEYNDDNKSLYNRNLYEICCEVERGNFDFFISIHSNAATEGNNVNYPSLFVRGENKVAFTPGADDAARTLWPFAYQDEHASWSNYSMTSVGLYYDIDFWHGDYVLGSIDGVQYKGYYGVLRHGVLGFLCEGYFHTYQPARHRAMNVDVCRHEGTGYAHGIAAILGLETEKYGELYGIVRDKHERFRHAYYNCSDNSADTKKPINGATVKLYKDGVEIDSYTTDNEWNGAFVFPRVDPGEYTISVTAPGYLEAEEDYCGPFVVEASKTTYPRVYLVSENYEMPASHRFDYPDEAADAGIACRMNYELKRNYTEKNFTSLKYKTIRRFICRGDKLYLLAVDKDKVPTVVVINADKVSMLANLPATTCEGSEYALSDIQVTADGYLVGCAMQKVSEGENGGECKIYRWRNNDAGIPEGEPRLWFTTKTTGGLGNAVTGASMVYSGTYLEGNLMISSTAADNSLAFTSITVSKGKKGAETIVATPANFHKADALGDFTLTLSPIDSKNIILNSGTILPAQYSVTDFGLQSVMNADNISAESSHAGFFRHAGRSMMVAPSINVEGKNVGICLYDISEGLDKAKVVTTSNTVFAGVTGTAAAAGRTDIVYDEAGKVTGAELVLFTVRNNGKISRFTTTGVEQPESALVEVSIDDAAGAEYFDLKGMRVEAASLVPGIYIRRCGNTTDKVLVK